MSVSDVHTTHDASGLRVDGTFVFPTLDLMCLRVGQVRGEAVDGLRSTSAEFLSFGQVHCPITIVLQPWAREYKGPLC